MDEDDFLPFVKKHSQNRKQSSRTKNIRQRSKDGENKSQKSKSETKTVLKCVDSDLKSDKESLNHTENRGKNKIKSDTNLLISSEDIKTELSCDISTKSSVNNDSAPELSLESNSRTLNSSSKCCSVSDDIQKNNSVATTEVHVNILNSTDDVIKSERFINPSEIVIKSEHSKQPSEKVIKSEHFTNTSEQGTSKQVTACPLCWKKFDKGQLHIAHLKACATKNGVDTQTLLNALELQKKQAAEREALGLPELVAAKKPTAKKNIGVSKDANLQLALALSASLQEAEEKEEDQILEVGLIDGIMDEKVENVVVQKQKKLLEQFGFTSSRPALPSSVKSKTAILNKLKNRIPPLLSRSVEERERLITEKVAIILMGEDDSQGSSSSFTFKEKTESATELPRIPTIKSLKKYCDKESSLWGISSAASEGESRAPYYVQDLSGNITPSEIEPGSKLKRLSQVHDYFTLPEPSVKNIQPVIDVFENSEDAVEDSDLVIQNTPASNTVITPVKPVKKKTVPQCELVTDSLKLFVNDWKSLVNKQSMSDITIYVKDEKEVYAHKLVFYVRCSAILVDLIKEEDHRSSKIREMLMWSEFSFQSVIAFLEYIYCGEMSGLIHLGEGIHELKQLAKRYSVYEILKHIEVMNKTRKSDSDTSVKELTSHANVSPLDYDASHIAELGNVSICGTSHAAELSNVSKNSSPDKESDKKLCEHFSLENKVETPCSQMIDNSREIMMSQSSPDPFSDSVNEHLDEDLNSSQGSRKSIDVLLSLMSKSQLTNSFNSPSRELKISNITPDKKDVMLSSMNNSKFTESPSKRLICDNLSPKCQSVYEDVPILDSKLDTEQSVGRSSKGFTQVKVSTTSDAHDDLIPFSLERESQFRLSFNSPSKEVKNTKSEADSICKVDSVDKESVRSCQSDSDNITSPVPHLDVERMKRKCNSQISSSSKKLCFDIQECDAVCETPVKKSDVLDLTKSDSEEEILNYSQNGSLIERPPRVKAPNRCEIRDKFYDDSEVKSSPYESNFDTATTSSSYICNVWDDFEEIGVVCDFPYPITPKSGSKNFSFRHALSNTPTKSQKQFDTPKFMPFKSPKQLISPNSTSSKSPEYLESPKSTPSKSPKNLESPNFTSTRKVKHLDSPKSTPNKNQISDFISTVGSSLHPSCETNTVHIPPEDVQEISSDSSILDDSPESLQSPVVDSASDNYKKLLDDSFATNFDSYSLSLLQGTSGFSKSVSKRKQYSTPSTRSTNPDQSPAVVISNKVTPRPEYTTMKTPQLEKELNRFGIKNLKKNQAKKLLRHIYNELHPVVPTHNEDKSNSEIAFEGQGMNVRRSRSPKKKLVKSPPKKTSRRNLMTGSKPRNSKSEDSDCENLPSSRENSVGDSSGNSCINEQMVLEDVPQDTVEGNPDFCTAVRSYIIKNPELYKKILTYEPIWLEELQKSLKAQKLKFNTNQLMDFLDEECITFRTAQNQTFRSRRKRRKGRSNE